MVQAWVMSEPEREQLMKSRQIKKPSDSLDCTEIAEESLFTSYSGQVALTVGGAPNLHGLNRRRHLECRLREEGEVDPTTYCSAVSNSTQTKVPKGSNESDSDKSLKEKNKRVSKMQPTESIDTIDTDENTIEEDGIQVIYKQAAPLETESFVESKDLRGKSANKRHFKQRSSKRKYHSDNCNQDKVDCRAKTSYKSQKENSDSSLSSELEEGEVDPSSYRLSSRKDSKKSDNTREEDLANTRSLVLPLRHNNTTKKTCDIENGYVKPRVGSSIYRFSSSDERNSHVQNSYSIRSSDESTKSTNKYLLPREIHPASSEVSLDSSNNSKLLFRDMNNGIPPRDMNNSRSLDDTSFQNYISNSKFGTAENRSALNSNSYQTVSEDCNIASQISVNNNSDLDLSIRENSENDRFKYFPYNQHVLSPNIESKVYESTSYNFLASPTNENWLNDIVRESGDAKDTVIHGTEDAKLKDEQNLSLKFYLREPDKYRVMINDRPGFPITNYMNKAELVKLKAIVSNMQKMDSLLPYNLENVGVMGKYSQFISRVTFFLNQFQEFKTCPILFQEEAIKNNITVIALVFGSSFMNREGQYKNTLSKPSKTIMTAPSIKKNLTTDVFGVFQDIVGVLGQFQVDLRMGFMIIFIIIFKDNDKEQAPTHMFFRKLLYRYICWKYGDANAAHINIHMFKAIEGIRKHASIFENMNTTKNDGNFEKSPENTSVKIKTELPYESSSPNVTISSNNNVSKSKFDTLRDMFYSGASLENLSACYPKTSKPKRHDKMKL